MGEDHLPPPQASHLEHSTLSQSPHLSPMPPPSDPLLMNGGLMNVSR